MKGSAGKKQVQGSFAKRKSLSIVMTVSVGLLLMLALIASASGAGVNMRVSTATGGGQANGGSYTSAVSNDGTLVAFDSDAANLVYGDTNGARDVFVKNSATGQTTRVSTSSAGDQQYGENPSISADGRYVAFQSLAGSLVAGDTNGKVDVFLKDTSTGALTRVSPLYGQDPAISADGRYVAFVATSSISSPNTACGTVPDTSIYWSSCVFRHDRQTGTTARVSSGWGASPSISADGRYVAFDESGNVIVRDMLGGNLSVVPDGLCEGYDVCSNRQPAISADGRYVHWRFYSEDWTQVFRKDLVGGGVTLVMEFSAEGLSFSAPAISGDGRYVAYESRENPRAYGNVGIFVKDMQTSTVTEISRNAGGTSANTSAFAPAISGDGNYASFTSAASNLVLNDTNGVADVFLAAVTAPACEPNRPALSLTATGAFWGSYDEYQAGLLSVNYSIGNAGPGAAAGVQLTAAVNTMGVGTVSGIPGSLGDVAAAGSASTVIKYSIPDGVTTFKSSLYATASDSCGVSYDYPGPGPGV